MLSALCIKHSSAICYIIHKRRANSHWDHKDVPFADIPVALGVEAYFSGVLSVMLGAGFLIPATRARGPGRCRRKEDWAVVTISLVKATRKPWPSFSQINRWPSLISSLCILSHDLVCKNHELQHHWLHSLYIPTSPGSDYFNICLNMFPSIRILLWHPKIGF